MPTLLRHGRVHSPTDPAATAMLVDGGAVVWVGQDDAAADHAGAGTEVVDLAGCLVTPAFVDAHVHTTATGLALTSLDLRMARSLAEALDAIERAARAARGRPLLGGGWNETSWPEARPPTAAELDRASYGGLVYLARVDIHSAVVSSSLLAAVPHLAGTPGWAANGWIHEPAHDVVREAAQRAMTRGQRSTAQRAALQSAAAFGIACVHEMAGPVISDPDDLAALLALAAEEPLPEVIGYWGELGGVDTARELGAVGAAGDLFCDGSLGSHTAALSAPYTDRPDTSGLLRHETAQLAEHIARCLAAGLQTGFHAIGDAAVDQALDAFDLVSAQLGRPAGVGQRLEHVEYVTDPARLAASGVLASMQPCFDALWGGGAGMYGRRLGTERARGLNRFADLAAAGVPLAFGSDSPVTELGPWAAIRAAAHPHEPGAAIGAPAAFDAHTRGGWQAAGIDGAGELVPGSAATYAIWRGGTRSTDPGSGLPDLAPGTPLPSCVATVLRGRPVHDPDSLLDASG